MTVIFVFGSNLAGHHGKGAAAHARIHYGAQFGVGEGRTGESYAIPTKDEKLVPLPLHRIGKSIDAFIDYATIHRDLTFLVTAIGCGYAGYQPEDIAPRFKRAPENCFFSPRFIGVNPSGLRFSPGTE